MDAHIDQFLGFLRTLEGRLDDRFRFAHEGHDRPVRRLAGIHVQHFHALDRTDRRHDGVDDTAVPSLAVIGNAFNDSFHRKVISFIFQI